MYFLIGTVNGIVISVEDSPRCPDMEWGGSYELQTYKGRHWMTYIGGEGTGYEAVKAPLFVGLASTKGDISTAHEGILGQTDSEHP